MKIPFVFKVSPELAASLGVSRSASSLQEQLTDSQIVAGLKRQCPQVCHVVAEAAVGSALTLLSRMDHLAEILNAGEVDKIQMFFKPLWECYDVMLCVVDINNSAAFISECRHERARLTKALTLAARQPQSKLSLLRVVHKALASRLDHLRLELLKYSAGSTSPHGEIPGSKRGRPMS